MRRYEIPCIPKQASDLLAHCDSRFADITESNLHQLVGFIGANPEVWTEENVILLRNLLCRVNYNWLTNEILNLIADTPHPHIVDECKKILRMAFAYREMLHRSW